MIRRLAVLMLFGLAAGCVSDSPAADIQSGVIVDSIRPIEEELEEFRATLPGPVAALSDAFISRDSLAAEVVRGIAVADTAALRRLTLTRGEFAYLYYPHTQYVRPPYELSPALVWYRLESYGGRGLSRALSRYAGQPLAYRGHACEDEPLRQGDTVLWHDCVVTVELEGEALDVPLLGPVLELEGRFKLLSFANGL